MSPRGTDVLSEALSCPRPIQVFFIIPAGESGIAYVEPSTTGRDVVSSSGFAARVRLEDLYLTCGHETPFDDIPYLQSGA